MMFKKLLFLLTFAILASRAEAATVKKVYWAKQMYLQQASANEGALIARGSDPTGGPFKGSFWLLRRQNSPVLEFFGDYPEDAFDSNADNDIDIQFLVKWDTEGQCCTQPTTTGTPLSCSTPLIRCTTGTPCSGLGAFTTCTYYNTPTLITNFKLKAIALPSTRVNLVPSMTAAQSDIDIALTTPGAEYITSTSTTCIEDGAQPGTCCNHSSGECAGRVVRYELTFGALMSDGTTSSTVPAASIRLVGILYD